MKALTPSCFSHKYDYTFKNNLSVTYKNKFPLLAFYYPETNTQVLHRHSPGQIMNPTTTVKEYLQCKFKKEVNCHASSLPKYSGNHTFVNGLQISIKILSAF